MDSSRTLMIRQLAEAGFTSESVAAAVAAEDLRLLVHPSKHQVRLWVPNDDGGGQS